MTIVAHERFQSPADAPDYEIDRVNPVGAGAASITLKGLEKASAATGCCAASTFIFRPASSWR
jgi:hypothetical protein